MWAFTGLGGGYVEQAIPPVEEILPLPANLSAVDAVSLAALRMSSVSIMIFILSLESGRGSRLRYIEDTGGLLRPFCAIPRPAGTPQIAEEERPGVTPWQASYVIEFCPRKNGGGRPRERGP